MADGDQLWSVPKLEYDLLRRNASTNGRKTDLIERYINFNDVLFSIGATWTFNKYNNIEK
jgi:hypothetical protein